MSFSEGRSYFFLGVSCSVGLGTGFFSYVLRLGSYGYRFCSFVVLVEGRKRREACGVFV